MNSRCLLLFVAWCATWGRLANAELPARSVSSSKQFLVYCDDTHLRGRVTGFAEEVKSALLTLLGEPDRWKLPIVISLSRAPTPSAVPVQVRLFDSPDGATIQIEAKIGDRPADVHLQKQIVRAVLLEIEYRAVGSVKGGERYVEAPWWLIEGALQIFQQKDLGVTPDIFQAMVSTNKLPPIADLLVLNNDDLGATARAIDAAFAMCFVQLLIEQPNGRANLGRLLRRWPQMHDDPVAALAKDFPGLAASGNGLQKWWALNVAHFSATDRYRGLTAEATDRELAALLQFEVVADKAGGKKTFTIGQFPEFVKLPGNKAAMTSFHTAIVALSTRANGLFRPILHDYEKISSALIRGKTRRIAEQLEQVERYRENVIRRTAAIGDYLNWYEATQLGQRSDAFDSFLKAANEISAEDARIHREDPIAKYLDQLEAEF